MASFEDVNKDGYMDLMVHIDTRKRLDLDKEDTLTELLGKTYDEPPIGIKGVDTVKIKTFKKAKKNWRNWTNWRNKKK
jgi:hypothetical protein